MSSGGSTGTGGSTGNGGSPGVGEVTAEQYESYKAVVDVISQGIADQIKQSLAALSTPTEISEMMAQSGAGEAAGDPEALFDNFWTVAKGLDCRLDWQSVTGVPKKQALTAFEIRPPGTETSSTPGYSSGESEGEQEWGFSVSAFGCGIGFQF
jgi:hypothetical protein